MSLNGGDPRTYKKVHEDGNANTYQQGTSASSNNQNLNNTHGFTNQTSSSSSHHYSTSNKNDSYNRSSNDRSK